MKSASSHARNLRSTRLARLTRIRRLRLETLEDRHMLSGNPTIVLGGSEGNENDGQTQHFTWTGSDSLVLSPISVQIQKDGSPIFGTTTPANAVADYNFDYFGPGSYGID